MRSQPSLNRRFYRKRILIVGEGIETEYNYFFDVRSLPQIRSHFEITVRRTGRDAVSVVKEAIKEATKVDVPYSKVWCVVDVELASNYANIQEARELIRKNRVAKKNNMELCLSNPCFEVWLLAHFIKTDQPFKGCQPLKSSMDKHWEPIFGHKYEESTQDVFAKLYEKLPAAVERSKSLLSYEVCAFDKNSSTEVYRIIEALGLVAEDEKRGLWT